MLGLKIRRKSTYKGSPESPKSPKRTKSPNKSKSANSPYEDSPTNYGSNIWTVNTTGWENEIPLGNTKYTNTTLRAFGRPPKTPPRHSKNRNAPSVKNKRGKRTRRVIQ
jgi:hypothetical protein